MTPQELKNSILQLAIQGKLVEQRPEEGTAKELYKKIQAEKQKLIKAGKIKKEKPLPEITEDEIPFEIPESWKWVRLGEIGSWGSGATPSRTNPNYYGGNIPWLKTGDLNDGYITEVPEHITELALEKTSVRLNPEGSVLIAMYGATIGKLGIAKIPLTTNQACCACPPLKHIYNKYLFYYLLATRSRFIKMGEGGAQPNISKEKIVNSVFAFPPLLEQKRIVAKIEELLPLADRYGEAWDRLEELNKRFPDDMRKSVLQLAIQGKLVEQRPEEGTAEELYKKIQAEKQKLIKAGKIKKEKPLPEITEDEIPFEIPESWKWVRLGEVVTFENGDRSTKYPKEKDYVKNGVPFFGAKDMDDNLMSFENVRYISKEKFNELGNGKLQDKDFICLLRGSVGKVAFFRSNGEHTTGFICAQMIIIRSISKMLCDYLEKYFSTPYYFSEIQKRVTGTAVRQLPGKDLSELLFPLPPIAEQLRVIKKTDSYIFCLNKIPNIFNKSAGDNVASRSDRNIKLR